MSDMITPQQLADASLDAQALAETVNGDENTIVTTRTGQTYPSAKKAIKDIFKAGGLPATPFATKALMESSELVDGDYAMVTDDTANDGLYVKTAGVWVKSKYDPQKLSMSYTDDLIAKFEMSILDKSKNLFDLASITEGFLIADDGSLTANSTWAYSDYIPVNPLQSYYFDGFRSVALYDSDKVFLSRQVTLDKGEAKYYGNITMPHDAAYVRLTFQPTVVTYVGAGRQFAMGASTVTYEPYHKPLLKDVDFSDDLQQKIKAITLIQSSFFKDNSVTNTFADFDINKAIVDLKVWGLPESEQLFLRTLYNAYTTALGDFSSIGFNSSAGYHIAPDLALQNDFNKYAAWKVSAPLSGVVTYFLYKNGDASNDKIGYVTVDWDKVPDTQVRFVNTTNGAQVKSDVSHDIVVDYLDKKINDNSASSPFAGKKIGGLGDSITWGFTPRNDTSGATSGTRLQSWLVLTAQKLGMSYDNKGISGSTLGANSAGANSPMSRRFDALADDCDIVVVMGGTNDVRKSVPLGTIDDRTDASYYGALHVICEGLINKYQVNQGLEIGKTKHIILATPIKLLETGSTLNNNLQNYAQAVRDVAAYYSLPVLDLNRHSNINPHILQTVQGTESGYMGVYNPYITDGTHPTQQGHEMMANYVTGFLKTLV